MSNWRAALESGVEAVRDAERLFMKKKYKDASVRAGEALLSLGQVVPHMITPEDRAYLRKSWINPALEIIQRSAKSK
jgi:hypothetical protein